MREVIEKISYLRGLIDGQNTADEAQKKLYCAIIEALEAISETLDYQEDSLDDLEESVLDLYDDMDELSECVEDFLDEWEDDEDDEDFDFIEAQCPQCGDSIFLDQDMLEDDEEFTCPSCAAQIFPASTDKE